ncbi:MAG: hypothetical protein HRT86_16225 [Ilumatobacteraceae bacterium]|nr:hypothetical protein [Ilumatobacteraceae bacterium]
MFDNGGTPGRGNRRDGKGNHGTTNDTSATPRRRRRLGIALRRTGLGGAVDAQQQPPGVDVFIDANGPGSPGVFDGLTVQVFANNGGTPGAPVGGLDCGETPTSTDSASVQGEGFCELSPGS